MIKKLLTLLAAGILAVSMSITVWAGEWKQDTTGWWYQNDNGSYPKNQWQEINGKQYYFGSNGYMLSNTTTPDGYKVGADGAWIQENTNAGNSLTPPQNYIELPLEQYGITWEYDNENRRIVNGQLLCNTWVHSRNTRGDWEYWHYYGADGKLLKNGTTPDGYKTNEFGLWDGGEAYHNGTNLTQNVQQKDLTKTKRASEYDSKISFWDDEEGFPLYVSENRGGIECKVIDRNVLTFRIKSEGSNIDPTNHSVLVYGAKATSESWKYSENIPYTVVGGPQVYSMEYDKPYSYDFTGTGLTAQELSQYCIDNNLILIVSVIDDNASLGSAKTGWQLHIAYALPTSVKTGEIG